MSGASHSLSLSLSLRLLAPDKVGLFRLGSCQCHWLPGAQWLSFNCDTQHSQNQNSFGGYLRKWSDILICCHSSRDCNSLKISPRLYFSNCLHQSHQHCTILGHISPAVISSISTIKHKSIKCNWNWLYPTFTPDGRPDPTVPSCPQKPVSWAPCSAPASLCVQCVQISRTASGAGESRVESTSIKHGDRGEPALNRGAQKTWLVGIVFGKETKTHFQFLHMEVRCLVWLTQ